MPNLQERWAWRGEDETLEPSRWWEEKSRRVPEQQYGMHKEWISRPFPKGDAKEGKRRKKYSICQGKSEIRSEPRRHKGGKKKKKEYVVYVCH